MKKSTRFLALMLCLVMVFALMPTFTVEAKAEEDINWQNDKIADTRILQFEKEFSSTGSGNSYKLDVTVNRHTLRPESEIKKYDTKTFSNGDYSGILGILDRGYSDSNIFLIPNGQGVQKYMIVRAQQNDYRGAKGTSDINRWWRWGTWVNDSEWVDSGANGMYARVFGHKNSSAGSVGWVDVAKTNEKSKDNHWTWTGGDSGQDYHTETGIGVSRGAGRLYMQIDTNMPVGTKGVLWSANGTLEGTIIQLGSIRRGAVEVGDRGEMTFSIAERSTVIYRLDGGTWGGDTRDVGFYTWSTKDAATAQLHDLIQEPTKEGYTFVGWECVKNGGNPKLSVGGIYQPYAVDHYDVTVHGEVDKGDYKIHSHDYDGKVEYGCLAVTDDTEFKAVWVKNDFTVKHVQNGNVVNTETIDLKDYGEYKTVAYNQAKQYQPTKKLDITGKTTEGKLYGGTFTDEACETPATAADLFNGGSAKSFDPKGGATYYIWEVTDEHLQPVNISTWVNNEGTYDVDHIYLLTAIDRLLYQEAGLVVNGTDYKDTANVAYDTVGVQFQKNGITIPLTYMQMTPGATTTANSKAVCIEITGYQKGVDYDMHAYWVTLDGVRVDGSEHRVFNYRGPGSAEANKQLYISDYSGPASVKSASPNNAPMRLMSMFSMAASTPVTLTNATEPEVPDVPDVPEEPEVPDVPEEPEVPEVPEEPEVPEVKATVTVVDGDSTYEVAAVDGMIALFPAGVDGKLFAGWYADSAFKTQADLTNVNDGDTVYAKYVSDKYMQVKYNATFTLLSKIVSLTSAVDSKNFAETGFVISTKNGEKTVIVNKYATKFALQNAKQLFGVQSNAPLMNVDYKLAGLSKNDTITITPYWVTADGTTVYGTARTLTYTGLTMRG